MEIFSETRRAWTCFFEYLELIFALFFLFFILNIQIKCSCLIGFYLKEWELIWKIDVFGKGIKFFGWMNKPNQKIKKLFIRPKKLILFLRFDFWGCLIVFWNRSFQFNWMLCWKWEASSKNNALYFRVRCGSSASKGIIFYLLIGMFWLLQWKIWCLKFNWQSQCSVCSRLSWKTVWHQLFRWSNYFGVYGK